MQRDPFDRRSPFEALERARRQRLLVATSNFLLVVAAPVIAPFAAMFISTLAWQTAVVFGITVLTVPVALVARALARRERTGLGGYIALVYFMLMIFSNGLLIDGLFPAVAVALSPFIIMAGMVLGTSGAISLAVLAVSLWALGWYLTTNMLIPPATIPPLVLGIMFGMITMASLAFTAFMSQLATRDLVRALNEATFDLVDANRRLEDASKLKSQFMARTSHELRTPLNSIIGYTDMTLRDVYGPLTPMQRDSLDRALRNSKRLKALINDILDLSKIEAGELELAEHPLSLANLVETIRTVTGPQAERKGLKFEVSIADDMPDRIVGDENRLTQVMLNVADNAIKFTEAGSVKIRLERHSQDQWVIRVTDTGRGIHEKDQRLIFDEFRQVEATGAPKEGTGLGLAIARHLVERMGGRIDVHSKLGAGSTFEIVLPLKALSSLRAPTPVESN